MTTPAALRELRELADLSSYIESRGSVMVRVDKAGGCAPATDFEIELWHLLRTAASEGVLEKFASAQESLPMDMQEAASRAFPDMLIDAHEADGWKHWSILERVICTAIDTGTIRLEDGKIVAVHPPEVARDAGRLDWLERQHVEVRTPARYGSFANFHASPEDDDETSDLRARVDAAISGASGEREYA